MKSSTILPPPAERRAEPNSLDNRPGGKYNYPGGPDSQPANLNTHAGGPDSQPANLNTHAGGPDSQPANQNTHASSLDTQDASRNYQPSSLSEKIARRRRQRGLRVRNKQEPAYYRSKTTNGQITMIHHDFLRKRRRMESSALLIRRGLELLYLASSLALLIYSLG